MAKTIDRRADGHHPVWSHEFTQLTWAAAVKTAQTVTIPINGKLRGMQMTINETTGNRTVTVNILDADDQLILLLKENQADNGTLFTEDTAYLDGNCQIQVTPSDVPGDSGMTVDIKLYGE